jgi:integrase
MSITLYIDKSKVDKRGLVPIFAAVRINAKNFKFQIEKTKLRYWNKTKQRINKNRESEPYNRHEEINSLLDRLTKDVSRFSRFDNYSAAPNRDEVKSVLLKVNPDEIPLNEAYEEFIESNRNKVAKNTTKNRNTAKNFIEDYQKYYSATLQFCDITLELFDKLYDFAFEVNDFETNTFVSYVAKFKAFLKWANEKGYYKGREHEKFTLTEKEKSIICLSPDEFKALYHHKFESEALDRARDLYCFGCLTGMRFSDISTLRYEHINHDYIVKNMVKTDEEGRIPILPLAKQIIEKYRDGRFYPLPQLSNAKLNKHIKTCCEKAGITTPTIKIRYKGNVREEKAYSKHKLITAHTARKTFITLAYFYGMDTKIIKSITGHKTDKNFDKYLLLSDEMKKDSLMKAMGNL